MRRSASGTLSRWPGRLIDPFIPLLSAQQKLRFHEFRFHQESRMNGNAIGKDIVAENGPPGAI